MSKSTDKGKGKAVDDPKDEKPMLNGKNEEEKKKDGEAFCADAASSSDTELISS